MKNKNNLKININTNIPSNTTHQKNKSLNYVLKHKRLISEISNDQQKLKTKHLFKQKFTHKNNYCSKKNFTTSKQISISDNSKITNQISSYRTNSSLNKQQNDGLILKQKNFQSKTNSINFNRSIALRQLNKIKFNMIQKTKENQKNNTNNKTQIDFNYSKLQTTRKLSINNNRVNNLNNNSMIMKRVINLNDKKEKNYTIKGKSKILLAKVNHIMNKSKNFRNNQLLLMSSNVREKKKNINYLSRALTGTNFSDMDLNINVNNNDFSQIKNSKKATKKRHYRKYNNNKINGLNIKIFTSFLNKYFQQKKHLLTEINKQISPSNSPHSNKEIYYSLNNCFTEDNMNQDEFNSKETKDNTIFNQSCNATKIKYIGTNESMFFENNKTNFESPEDLHFFYVTLLQHGKNLNEKF